MGARKINTPSLRPRRGFAGSCLQIYQKKVVEIKKAYVSLFPSKTATIYAHCLLYKVMNKNKGAGGVCPKGGNTTVVFIFFLS